MIQPEQHEVVVVGRGLIGAAAARHLAEAGVDVAVVGPGEPVDPTASTGPFASHYDSGRITRLADKDPVWAELAARSIARYDHIAAASGIAFYGCDGLVAAVPNPERWVAHSQAHGGVVRMASAADIADRFGIAVPEQADVVLEESPAGHVDPRRLVAAQTEATRLAGGAVVDRAVTAVEPLGGRWRVTAGEAITAERVIVATGSFGSALLPEPLALERRPRTVVLAEVSGSALPSLIWHPQDDPDVDYFYWVPPVPYPDGRVLLKAGCFFLHTPVTAEADLVEWFQSAGSDDEAAAIERHLVRLLPRHRLAPLGRLVCVTASTPTGRPYVGEVAEGLLVALGGNGAAAKSSDEIGRLAAVLAHKGAWEDDVLAAADFRPATE